VIAIIGILAALLLPAINRARESGRRTQCQSNIRQLAMAAISYEGDQGQYPNSGTYGVQFIGNQPYIDPNKPKHSWVVDLLPYIEQQAIHDSWNFLVDIPGRDDDQDGMTDELDEAWQSHPNWNWASPSGGLDTMDGVVGVAIDAGSINPDDPDNAALSHKVISLLICPNDETSINQGGGLSYGCNSGYGEFYDATGAFAFPYHNWSWTQIDWNGVNGFNGDGGILMANNPLTDRQDAQWAKMMGVFWAGSQQGKAIDEGRSTSASISSGDGLSQTIMFAENVNLGLLQSAESTTHGDYTWAFPWTAATGVAICTLDICPNGIGGTCNNPDLAGGNLDYGRANMRTANVAGYVNNNKERGLQEGQSPFASSLHGNVFIVAMCDGHTKIINDDIDGSVYVRLYSPQGGKLPKQAANTGLWQAPLSDGDY
jgi:hypothetical protein